MESITNLLILYAGVLLLNTVISILLFVKLRTRLHRAVLFLWSSTVIAFAAQGVLVASDLLLILGYSTVFLITLSLANLLATIVDREVRLRLSLVVLAIGFAASVAMTLAGLPFQAAATPLCIAICFPVAHTLVVHMFRNFRSLTFTGKGLAISSVFYVIHTLDYPLLRRVDSFAPMGFTIATLILFALSIFAPAVALEAVTKREARNSAELDVARRIQTKILPKNPKLDGYDVNCFMKPAEEVGGDYYDIFSFGDYTWILLGDVTGHGLSSGLVMLMAQSIMRAIVQTRSDISPTELNTLANRVLFENLRRLEEHRTMTIVSFSCRRQSSQFSFSGTHDNIYLWRSATESVEVLEVGHFPCGLGLLEEVDSYMKPETNLDLRDGDLLFLGTDGVTEAAKNGDYAMGLFDEKRLVGFLEKNGRRPLDEIRHDLLGEISVFTNGVFHDDITFVMIRKTDAAVHPTS
jgi:serine phosphatase RsbU (regulator of sigma subunit)